MRNPQQHLMFQLPEEPLIGPWLCRLREHHGFTRKDVARRTGITESTLKYFEQSWEKQNPRRLGGAIKKRVVPYQHGAGVRLFNVRTILRFWGLELVVIPTSMYRPKYSQQSKLDFWKLTERQKSMAHLFVSGVTPKGISQKLDIDIQRVYVTLRNPKVMAYVNATKQAAYDSALASWSTMLLDSVKHLIEFRAEKARMAADKRLQKQREKRRAEKNKEKVNADTV